MGKKRLKQRSGFSLVEVMVALVFMAVVLLGAGAMLLAMLTSATREQARQVAANLAQDRLQLVLLDPGYPELESRYEKLESAVEGHERFTRLTDIRRVVEEVDSREIDYVMITVTVSGPGLDEAVSRSATVAAP